MTLRGRHRIPRGLSARLLALTVIFVMASQVLIFVPSVARYRLSYLESRVDAAHLAIFALEATPDNMVSKDLSDMLLAHVGAHGIVVHLANRTLMLAPDMPPGVDATYDLHDESMVGMMGDALGTLFSRGDRVLRVLDTAPKDSHAMVEILIDEEPLRTEMWEFGGRVFELSMIIALVTGALLYVALQWLLVSPLRRMTESMVAFREDPEDAARVIQPSGRGDELGTAQRELAAMEETVRQALGQKERLAALGTAVSKINHDLRGILATVRLQSDSLANSALPEVRRVVTPLLAAIDRAVALCTGTLTYTRENAPPLRKRRFALAGLVEEVADAMERPGNGFAVSNDVPATLMAEADRDQLQRAIENIARNAAESGATHCTIGAAQANGYLTIEIADDGPGLAPKARDNLFRPFSGSARPGGTGLGLAIAREVMRAHGGEIELKSSNASGTVFALTLASSRAPTPAP